LISLDTFYAETVKFGYNEGIDMINDISGGQFDEKCLKLLLKQTSLYFNACKSSMKPCMIK
jgi:dihydropteroate synthase